MYKNLSKVTCDFEKGAKNIGGDKAWILIARSGCLCRCVSIMNSLDKIVRHMPATETEQFRERIRKIFPTNAKAFLESYDDEFLDAMVELVGWGWLYDKYPQNQIQLATPGEQKTPDLIVKDSSGNLLAVMECKRLRNSDVNTEFFKNHNILSSFASGRHNIETRPVDTRLLSYLQTPAKTLSYIS
jgi:hypothetical protein